MTNGKKINWDPWNEERQRFRDLETQGFEKDMKRLEAHINNLLNMAPKDSTGFVNLKCLDVINLLRQDLHKAKVYAGLMP